MNSIFRVGNHVVGVLAGLFLVGIMALTVGNVVVRLFGSVISGTYELSTVMVVVVAGLSLGYAAFAKTHVVVDIVVCHFPKRIQGIIDSVMAIIGLALWGVVTWQNVAILLTRWGNESTELLDVPYFPFRILWVAGLVFLCLMLMRDIRDGIRRAVGK